MLPCTLGQISKKIARIVMQFLRNMTILQSWFCTMVIWVLKFSSYGYTIKYFIFWIWIWWRQLYFFLLSNLTKGKMLAGVFWSMDISLLCWLINFWYEQKRWHIENWPHNYRLSTTEHSISLLWHYGCFWTFFSKRNLIQWIKNRALLINFKSQL